MSYEPFIGEIFMAAFSFAPRGFALCDGQILSISQNQALFSILGTTYGGNGTSTFALPDLRGRVPMHWGTGAGLTPRTLGQRGGLEGVTLRAPQIASHTHNVRCSSGAGDQEVPAGATWAADRARQTTIYAAGSVGVVDMHIGAVLPAGGSQAPGG